jgi:hypothetical protein
MSDPRVFRKAKLPIGLDAKRASHTRLIRTALLVIASTAIWGLVAFLLINDTRTAVIATVLIGLAALTVRIFDHD